MTITISNCCPATHARLWIPYLFWIIVPQSTQKCKFSSCLWQRKLSENQILKKQHWKCQLECHEIWNFSDNFQCILTGYVPCSMHLQKKLQWKASAQSTTFEWIPLLAFKSKCWLWHAALIVICHIEFCRQTSQTCTGKDCMNVHPMFAFVWDGILTSVGLTAQHHRRGLILSTKPELQNAFDISLQKYCCPSTILQAPACHLKWT